MASPVVAATAALVIASGVLGPNPAPAAVRWRLEQTARPLGEASDAADYGHGLVDAAAATAPGGPGAVTSRRRSTSKSTSSTTTTASTTTTNTSTATTTSTTSG